MMDWHRLFGLLLIDYFTNSPFVVELEKGLSHQQQFLDVVILRRRKGRSAKRVSYGAEHYRQRSPDTSTLIHQLFERYQGEGVVMPYTMKDFRRDFVKEHFKELSAEERRELLENLTPEERLEGLSLEEIEQVLEKLRAERSSGQRKSSRKKRSDH